MVRPSGQRGSAAPARSGQFAGHQLAERDLAGLPAPLQAQACRGPERVGGRSRQGLLQAAGPGEGLAKHIYRVDNKRADSLTHEARNGQESCWADGAPDNLVALRGFYDGGRDVRGSAAAWL
eukprot:1126402-Lingulodinium_polyedra.AAC.1